MIALAAMLVAVLVMLLLAWLVMTGQSDAIQTGRSPYDREALRARIDSDRHK